MRKILPLGKSPIVIDDSLTLAESGAVIEYLVERYGHGRLIPAPGAPERLRYRYWLRFAEGSAMPPLLLKLVFDRAAAPVPFFVKPVVRGISRKVQTGFVDPNIMRQMDFMESELDQRKWFAGPDPQVLTSRWAFRWKPLRHAPSLMRTAEADVFSRMGPRAIYAHRRPLACGGRATL